MAFYHGGPKGLKTILPPSRSGAKSSARYGEIFKICKTSKVYVTTEYAAAAMYASCHRKGSIYEVEPIGKLEHDPDCSEPGVSFECDEVKILSETRLKPSEAFKIRRFLIDDLPDQSIRGGQ